MARPLILHVETATDICSVAISKGDQLLALVESGPERSHARLLNQYIRKGLEESGITFQQLDAVAVSKGPGSYTGLRIGVSTSKGIAYALRVPLLSCGTLEHMARGALARKEVQELADDAGRHLLLCPMLDARRMEVYHALYTTGFEVVEEVSARIIEQESFSRELDRQLVCFFGPGAGKCREVINHPNARFVDDVQPSARDMIIPVSRKYADEEFEDVAYFEPFYLKDFIATIPRKKVL
jgi:tRNA threonylcarbamoyladenosine biosynthesis protein TsaB